MRCPCSLSSYQQGEQAIEQQGREGRVEGNFTKTIDILKQHIVQKAAQEQDVPTSQELLWLSIRDGWIELAKTVLDQGLDVNSKVPIARQLKRLKEAESVHEVRITFIDFIVDVDICICVCPSA